MLLIAVAEEDENNEQTHNMDVALDCLNSGQITFLMLLVVSMRRHVALQTCLLQTHAYVIIYS